MTLMPCSSQASRGWNEAGKMAHQASLDFPEIHLPLLPKCWDLKECSTTPGLYMIF